MTKKEKKGFNLKELYKNNKKAIIGLLVVIVLLIIILILNNAGTKQINKSNKHDHPVTTEVKEETKYEGLSFTNVTLEKDEQQHQYTLSAIVTNTTNETIDTEQVDIVLKDKDDKEIITLLGYIGEGGLKPNKSITIHASTSDQVDLDKATVKIIKAHE